MAVGTYCSAKTAAVISKEAKNAMTNSPAPQIIPTLMDQKRKTKSIGSFTAVRNLTMDNAPTIPKDITTLDWMERIIAAVIRESATKETLKLLL